MKFKVNRGLLPMKAHFFLFNAGTAPVIPFMSTFAKQLGFSPSIVGIIYTILPIMGMLAKPIMGMVADRFHAQKLIFLTTLLIMAAAFLGLSFIPEINVDTPDEFNYNSSGSTVLTCVNNSDFNRSESMHCDLRCPMKISEWRTICNEWNASDDCNNMTHNKQTDVQDSLDDCVSLQIENISFTMEYAQNFTNVQHYILSKCSIQCRSGAVENNITTLSIKDQDVIHVYQFWLFLTLMLIGWTAMAVEGSVADTICFELLGDKPYKYGQQRLYGSLGYGLFGIIAGVMIDTFSEGQSNKNYESAFYLAVVMLLGDFLVSYFIKCNHQKSSPNIIKDVSKLLANIKILIFMLWCLFIGILTSLTWQFLFWLLEELAENQGPEMKSSIKTLQGITMSIQCLLGELPFFFLSGWILRQIGHINAMTLVLLAFGIRLILYSVIKDPWWFLPVELTNGFTFGLFYACMASYASIVSPEGTETTVQGMVGAVFEGIGVSLGSLLGGLVYDKYGGPETFRIFGIASLSACVLHATVQYVFVQRHALTQQLTK